MQSISGTEYLAPEPRRWPTVLGVLAIVWGMIGFVSSASSLVGVGQGAQPEVMREGSGGALTTASLMLAIVLTTGGVQLLRRRASGVWLLRGWSPLTTLAQGAVLALMITHRAEFEGAFRESLEHQIAARATRAGGEAQRVPEGVVQVMWAAGLGCGGLAAVVPPGITAFFVFGRRSREVIAEWSAVQDA